MGSRSLQIAWQKKEMEVLVPWILVAMIPLLLGALATGAVHFLRYQTSMTYQTKGAVKGRIMTANYQIGILLSLIYFIAGMAIIVAGAFQNITQSENSNSGKKIDRMQ